MAAARKARFRARVRAENPPVLYSKNVAPLPPGANPAGPQAPLENGGAIVAPVVPLDFIAWSPEDFREIISELIPAAEQQFVKGVTERAVKSKLAPDLLKDIERESRWDEPTKVALTKSLPALSAKYLNMTGVSAAYKNEGILALCLVRLWRKKGSLESRLDKIIAQNEALLNPEKKT
jgi:hypothetical protein